MMGRGGRAAVLIVALAAMAAPSSAQQRRGPPSGADRAELEQRVRARFAEIIKNRLGLTDPEAERLGQVMRSFEGDRRALREAEVALRRSVEAFVASGAQDDARATELMRSLAELRAREAALFAREQQAMLEVLSPTQLLRFHAVREELNQRVQRLRGRRPGGPDGPDGRRRPGGGTLPPAVFR